MQWNQVYLDEDLYQFYSNIEDGRKGQVVREALKLYRDLRDYTSANNIADILAEIKQGFQKIERLLKEKPDLFISSAPNNDHQKEKFGAKADMADLFVGFLDAAES